MCQGCGRCGCSSSSDLFDPLTSESTFLSPSRLYSAFYDTGARKLLLQTTLKTMAMATAMATGRTMAMTMACLASKHGALPSDPSHWWQNRCRGGYCFIGNARPAAACNLLAAMMTLRVVIGDCLLLFGSLNFFGSLSSELDLSWDFSGHCFGLSYATSLGSFRIKDIFVFCHGIKLWTDLCFFGGTYFT